MLKIFHQELTEPLTAQFSHQWFEWGRPATGAPNLRFLWVFHRTIVCLTSSDISFPSTSELTDQLNMRLKSADLGVLLKSADLVYRSLDAIMHFQEYTNGCKWFYIVSGLTEIFDPSIAIYPLVLQVSQP